MDGGDRAGWFVYMLRCGDGSLYTGVTNDLARRVERHAAGKGARYTRSRRPVEIVYQEAARDRGAALRREAALKKLNREEKIALVRSSGSSRRPPPSRARSRAAARLTRGRSR